MIGKHEESSYCDEARLTSKYYVFLNDTRFSFVISFYMRTQPLSYKWACPNFNNEQNFSSLNFLEFKGGVDTGEGFWQRLCPIISSEQLR